MEDGQIVVIGGLRRKETTLSQDKVPLLGDLPLVGALFSHDKKVINNSELLVMISPHIHEYKGLTKYQKRKFNEIKKAKPLKLPDKNRPEYEILEENLPSYLE
jgi:type II secretory pathway component GspD/PulD (secretin)